MQSTETTTPKLQHPVFFIEALRETPNVNLTAKTTFVRSLLEEPDVYFS